MNDSVAAKLKDPRCLHFTRGEVAGLTAMAWRWGYEARVDEENARYPPPKIMSFGQWYEQALYRQECDRRARQPWATDDQGRSSG